MANFVPGDGPIPCDIMIVGEAPGAEEDKIGKPFVGRSGKLLDAALADAGLSRAEVYVTNVHKFRPPGNRRPTVEELVDGMELLAEELHKVQPSFVLLLGNTALSVMSTPGVDKITQARGFNLSPHLDHATYATFHPSAGLRNPEWKQAIFDDVAEFAKIARGRTRVVSGTGK